MHSPWQGGARRLAASQPCVPQEVLKGSPFHHKLRYVYVIKQNRDGRVVERLDLLLWKRKRKCLVLARAHATLTLREDHQAAPTCAARPWNQMEPSPRSGPAQVWNGFAPPGSFPPL